jgi:hypothetical protein
MKSNRFKGPNVRNPNARQNLYPDLRISHFSQKSRYIPRDPIDECRCDGESTKTVFREKGITVFSVRRVEWLSLDRRLSLLSPQFMDGYFLIYHNIRADMPLRPWPYCGCDVLLEPLHGLISTSGWTSLWNPYRSKWCNIPRRVKFRQVFLFEWNVPPPRLHHILPLHGSERQYRPGMRSAVFLQANIHRLSHITNGQVRRHPCVPNQFGHLNLPGAPAGNSPSKPKPRKMGIFIGNCLTCQNMIKPLAHSAKWSRSGVKAACWRSLVMSCS